MTSSEKMQFCLPKLSHSVSRPTIINICIRISIIIILIIIVKIIRIILSVYSFVYLKKERKSKMEIMHKYSKLFRTICLFQQHIVVSIDNDNVLKQPTNNVLEK